MRPIQIWDLENFFKSLEGHSLPAYLASNSYSFALPELAKRVIVTPAFYPGLRKKANSTRCSQAVSHPSTNRARRCLTSVIGREPVYSAWYGRRQMFLFLTLFIRYITDDVIIIRQGRIDFLSGGSDEKR